MIKKRLLFLFVILFSFRSVGQEGLTFQIETLSKPEYLLRQSTFNEICRDLILLNSDVPDNGPFNKEEIDFKYNILAKSKLPDSLINFGFNAFFNGMYRAYADHRPFVLSPDMIWLLISQGFARHVNANAEELREMFVNFSGQTTLVVKNDTININDPEYPWQEIFPEFTDQIAKYTGKELIELLTADFTTTTPVEKIASEITIMEAMKPYFEYVVIKLFCGIPEITLKGTTEDWQDILERTVKLGEYNLEWWTDELEPLLEEFVKTSKGEIDAEFWRNMFKYHSDEDYGSPRVIDGWIVKFFPYNEKGEQYDLDELIDTDALPDEIVKVDLIYREVGGPTDIEIPLELWAGFFGVEQNKENFALTPRIGWMIRKKDVNNDALKLYFETINKPSNPAILPGVVSMENAIDLLIDDYIPRQLFELKRIYNLSLTFREEIKIPDQLAECRIDLLRLSGDIDDDEIERIKKMFPETRLIINDELINKSWE